jgi:multiple sugar transport system substrate-binding protein
MEYLTRLVVEDQVSPSYSFSKTVGAMEHFMSGTVAMIPAGCWNMARLRGITDFEWDVAEFPRSPFTGERQVASNVLGFIIGPNTTVKEETLEVVAAFTSQEPMMAMAAAGANIPARKDSRAPYFNLDVPANAEAYERALDYIHPMILSEYVSYPETLRILTTDALEKMYNGKEPAAEAWLAGVAEIEALLEERVE